MNQTHKKIAWSLTACLSVGALGGLSHDAFAATASVSQTVTYGPQLTNWGVNAGKQVNGSVLLSFNQFNTALGTLTAVKMQLDGTSSVDAFIANLDQSSAHVTLVDSATITLTRPDLSTLVVTVPFASVAMTLAPAAYVAGPGDSGSPGLFFSSGSLWVGIGPNANPNDDKINLVNPSLSGPLSGIPNANTYGVTHQATGSNSLTTSNPLELALFTGNGVIDLPIGAAGQSSFTGGGNNFNLIRTMAWASATITYVYETPDAGVPEPLSASLTGLAGGAVVLAALRRRQRA